MRRIFRSFFFVLFAFAKLSRMEKYTTYRIGTMLVHTFASIDENHFHIRKETRKSTATTKHNFTNVFIVALCRMADQNKINSAPCNSQFPLEAFIPRDLPNKMKSKKAKFFIVRASVACGIKSTIYRWINCLESFLILCILISM